MKKTIPVSTRVGLLLIIAMACIVFFPSFQFQFTNWDDDIHVTNNPAVHRLSLESLALQFHPTSKYMYHPLTMVSYSLDWMMGQGSPSTFHAMNVLLHLFNIVLVFLVLRKILPSDAAVLFVTALFAIHPLQVESVAWISARKELLYAFFYLVSLLLYLEWNKGEKAGLYVLSIFFFLCALLSKPTAVTLPLVIILLEFWRSRKLEAKIIYRALPFLICAVAFTLLIIGTQNEGTIPPLAYYSFPQRLLLILYQVAFYVWKFVAPAKLSACYAYPQLVDNRLPLAYYAAPFLLVAIAAMVWFVKKKSTYIFPELIFYVVTLLPVLQLVPFNNASLVADRYMYLPILGAAFFFYQMVEFIEANASAANPSVRFVKEICCGLFIFGFFVISIGRVGVWKDSITLFNDVIDKNDGISIAYGNRANAKVQKGDFSGALEDCNRLIEITPNNGKAFYNKGNAESGLKHYREAVNDFTESVNLGYDVSSLYYNRGTAYYHVGLTDSALADYRASKLRDPNFADAPYSIGYLMLYAEKDPVTAIRYFDSALAINPNYTEALYEKASVEYDLRYYGSAMSDLAAAISRQPELRNDSLIGRVNRSIDSINTAISTTGKRLTGAAGSNRYRQERSKLYLMLGDSVRASLDMKLSGEYLKKRLRQ